ncbi:TetR/AcrR family transcriptional regulator [Thermomonospora umbrina]|uniref:TetR family transcriptional regulator n=1 Tax=Thermomonospora umbrina TaxID=111806 RepID=A0A3D9SFT4_9ACTN|nr:TetR/AcrR family transcriptional regulator [Thermomonospora umbrina]REE94762.1 TetR family transcriptional regulator [Thermomonospora umbrina]
MADDEGLVLDTATRLFAQLGYDAVTGRMIAEASGTDLGTSTKHDIYVAVMERTIRRRDAYLEPVLREFTPDADGLVRLVDGFLDFSLAHPEMPSLWMHRWLSDAQDLTDFDERFGAPWMREVAARVGRAVPPHVDADLTLWTAIWTINCFVQGGLLDAEGRRPSSDPRAQQRFREHLHLVLRLIATSRPAT